MRAEAKSKARAFTIIELLTVMSIIVVLIGLLVPALNQVRRFALDVKQRAQIKAIDSALEMFRGEFQDYPDSKAVDAFGNYYCGAMKLCEAVMGQDLMGVHKDSRFLAKYIQSGQDQLYRLPLGDLGRPENLRQRKGPYLEPENASVHMLTDIYPQARLGSSRFVSSGVRTDEMFVLCDVYRRTVNQGVGDESKIGMPILYYRADPAGTVHDQNDPGFLDWPTDSQNNQFIYNYRDNLDILALGKPWEASGTARPHTLATNSGLSFYSYTRNAQYDFSRTAAGGGTVNAARPYRPDSYILISAGWDGEYGTGDDITNFRQQ